ncbi:hypothetical protein C1645_822095 [Glomus cerebriforme]|uniref:Uncharacterized protein n=1 Tax=Glomus cerebriforme TaxID=658196 RepID=A0A397T235_9GLOM|nr:hypothetical protein C1645_822095 [Glomus cerebriforme]
MTQQVQVSALQTVKPVRQLKGLPSLLKTKEDPKNYYISKYLKKIGLLSKEELDFDYSGYFKPLTPINFQNTPPGSDNEEDSYDEENKITFKFAVKGNSEHISEVLEWYMNVTITLKNEKGKPIVTIIGNYACIDNEDHGKIYTNLTFSKTSEINDLPKEDQKSSCKAPLGSQVSANFSNPEKDLKKMRKA